MVAHTFDPSAREAEIGSDMAGQREEHKARGDRSSGLSVRFYRDSIQFEDLLRQNTPFGLRIL